MNNEVVGIGAIYSLGMLPSCMEITGQNTASLRKIYRMESFFYLIKEEKLSTEGKDRYESSTW